MFSTLYELLGIAGFSLHKRRKHVTAMIRVSCLTKVSATEKFLKFCSQNLTVTLKLVLK